jgi:selenocysteine-specific translation elongation factor
VVSGTIRTGDEVVALPSRQRSKVKAIVTYEGEIEAAISQQSVVLQLEDEIDLSRGDLLAGPGAPPTVSHRFAAMLVWLHSQPFELNRSYLLKHTSHQVKVKSQRIKRRVNINDFSEHPAQQLEMNEIAAVEFDASSALFFDSYERNRATGSFILIDPLSNATVGAGMIQEAIADAASGNLPTQSAVETANRVNVTLQERIRRHGHAPAIVLLHERTDIGDRVERVLFENNFEAVLLQQRQLAAAVRFDLFSALWNAGFVILYLASEISAGELELLRNLAGTHILEFTDRNDSAEELVNRVLAAVETLRAKTEFEGNEIGE